MNYLGESIISLIPTGGNGNVVGPNSSTVNALPRYSTTNGTTIKNSTVIVFDNGDMVVNGNLDVNGTITGGGGTGGDVTGPVGSTSDSITRFDGISGKLIKSGSAKISDAGAMTGVSLIANTSGFLTLEGESVVLAGTGLTGQANVTVNDNIILAADNVVELSGFAAPYGVVMNSDTLVSGDLTSTGTIEGGVLKKTGGTSSQYLMADGTSLQFSANSGNSNFYLYISNVTLTAPPGSGQVRYNNVQQSLATVVYINHLTSDNIDVEIFFNQLSSLNELYVQDRNSSINFIKYNITGTPTIFVNSYVSIPVTVSSFGGTGETSFGANHPSLISFFTNTLEVDTRLSTLETKTQNQAAVAGTTEFDGLVNFIGDVKTNSNVQFEGPGSVQIQNTGSCQIQPTGVLTLKGFNCTGEISLSNTKITSLATPTANADAATKEYADTAALTSFRWGTFTISFNSTATLNTTSGYMPTTGLAAIGAAAVALAQSGATTTLARIYKVVSNTSSVADGQRSGYIGTATFPVLYPRIGFNYNISFGMGDTNTTTTAVTQMLFGMQASITAPVWSSTSGPSSGSTMMGIGHDVGDTFLSWYMRGTAGGQKIATSFVASTPSAYWLNLNIYNPMNSTNVFLTLTDEISGLTSTQTFIFSSGSPTFAIFQSATLWPLHIRAMAVLGGITNSARCWFSRFQLSLK